MYVSHTLLKIPSHSTQYLTQNDQNSTRKSLHVSDNIVYSEICHKYIHIMLPYTFTVHVLAYTFSQVSDRSCKCEGMKLPSGCVVLGSRSIHTFGCCFVNCRGGLKRCTQKLHVNPVWEPHVSPNSFTFYTKFLAQNDQNSNH